MYSCQVFLNWPDAQSVEVGNNMYAPVSILPSLGSSPSGPWYLRRFLVLSHHTTLEALSPTRSWLFGTGKPLTSQYFLSEEMQGLLALVLNFSPSNLKQRGL